VRYADEMGDTNKARTTQEGAGLCADCIHARTVESIRGSVFFLCELSRTDSRFPKYPRLPVLTCAGFKEKANDNQYSDIL
jgi:hypothetical protein